MKKALFLSVFLFVISFIGSAQNPAKSIYAELGGPGVISVNFDTRFSKREDGLGGRIGIGGFTFRDWFNNNSSTTVIFIPLGINTLLGKDGKNYFEIGASVTPVITSYKGSTPADDETFSSTFGNVLFGYRLQPKNGGFTFRGFVSPIISKEGLFPFYGGISLGYKF